MVTVTLTTVALLVVAAPASALSRRQAVRLAERAIAHLSGVTRPLVIFGLRAPLSARAVVNEADGPGASFTPTKPIGHREWLYWADYGCTTFFAHPSLLVLLDARTGRVRAAHQLLWMPMINGTIAPWLSDAAAYDNPRYRVASSSACPAGAAPARSTSARRLDALSLIAGVPPPAFARPTNEPAHSAQAATTFTPVITKTQLAGDCIVMIGDRQGQSGGGEFNASFTAMTKFAAALGLAPDHIADAPSTVAGLQETIGNLVNATSPPCTDVFIYLAGHGIPARGARIQSGPEFQQLGPGQGGDAGVVTSWKQNDVGQTVPEDIITPQDLLNVMDAFEMKATFKIKIISCFSGRFLPDLNGQPNLIDAEASSADNQTSWAHLQRAVAKDPATGTFYPPDRTLNGVTEWKNKHFVANTTDNPDGADEATNGNIHGLETWASSPTELMDTGYNLGAGLHMAATSGLPYNFANTAGYATPQNYYNPFAHVVAPPPATTTTTTTSTTTSTETTATVGANLQTASNVDISNPNDTDVWQLIFDAAHASGIPTDSEVMSIMLRGYTVSGPTTIHFQGLAPQANGGVMVMNTTQAFTLPMTPGTYTFMPTNFFVKAGWYIGLSNGGGTDAIAFAMPGATLDTFSMNNGVNNGATFTGAPMTGSELNAQFTLLEGAEAP